MSKIINCIKFCGIFELALRGHDESDSSSNPGIFRGLINFSAELDKTLDEHLKSSSLFKGTSKEIQNDILDCILAECQERILMELKEAPYIAIMADETTDASSKTQLAIVFRYCLNSGDVVERFWTYLIPEKSDALSLSSDILNVLDNVIGDFKSKLIAQTYDGAAVMSGQNAGVQARIKEKYQFAHFVHCYAHQLNLIMTKAASANKQVRVFFGNIQEIPAFFSNSPQRINVLDAVVGKRIPHGTPTRWNFNIRTINVVYENRENLIDCMEAIEETFLNTTVCSAASSIRRMLQDSIFIFWLTFFHYIMPHVDILFQQLQKSDIDAIYVETCICTFEENIVSVRNSVDQIVSDVSQQCSNMQLPKRRRRGDDKEDNRRAAIEICDIIKNTAKDRFQFKGHLAAASLLSSKYFVEYLNTFPEKCLHETFSVYPNLNKERLKTELSLIYSRSDCRNIKGAIAFLKFIIQNNLSDVFTETKKLLQILATTPMSTVEAERCFSSLNRIKTFLRNSMREDRLVALSMLSIEKKFICESTNFNENVINKFAAKKSRKIELVYRK